MILKTIEAGVLNVAYYEYGSADGSPVIMCHGFPYDVHAYTSSSTILAANGMKVIVPFLRGYGDTRFLSTETPRSGEQAALAYDLISLMDALKIERALLAGYDWGGRAACIVSALWSERVTALVTGNSYNIQNISKAMEPAAPAVEASLWYQYFFHSERGRRGLEENRAGFAYQLWKMWSPTWDFDAARFDRTAKAFDNPDFVEVVIHSYRHRYGLVPGDPAMAHIENQLAAQPPIKVPTISIDGAVDGVNGGTAHHAKKFTGPHQHRVFENAGHNLPQESPDGWTTAIMDASRMA
ncbi:MAG: alpha/beta hydrolase [Sneathiella sp.]|uniref:alpha/beta fold hydrolase n=1 Tax=Sneathiella sp. TaxID=1964365 RepID=UPI000C40DA83|nr:alpha/beta hydrolase [Sneathiella sp.]MAZ04740.1 alpha/beta hydrolase [Sneathiella sp.]